MTAKIVQWENELWSYLDKGDGIHCPIYHNCQVRRRGGSCFEDNKPLHQYLRNIKMSNPENYFGIMASNTGYANFLNHWFPGRIFRLVERVANRYLKEGGVSRPPVSEELISLADKNNPIEVHLLPLKNYSGVLWKMSGRWVIQLRDKDVPAARRFTLYHEFFHILAHCHSTPIFNGLGKEGVYFNEILADYFACCILMPRAWVTEQWRQVNNLNIMADIFNVLESLVWIRLKQLRLTIS